MQSAMQLLIISLCAFYVSSVRLKHTATYKAQRTSSPRMMQVPHLTDCGKLSYSTKEECELYSIQTSWKCAWDDSSKTCATGTVMAPYSIETPPMFDYLVNGYGQGVPVAFDQARRTISETLRYFGAPLQSTIPFHKIATTGKVVNTWYGFANNPSYWNDFGKLIESATRYILLSTFRMESSPGTEVLAHSLKLLDESLQADVLLHVMYDDNKEVVDVATLLNAASWTYIKLTVHPYHHSMSQVNFSMQATSQMDSKVLIVDGREAIIHNANLQDRPVAALGVRLQGEVVDSMERGFFYGPTRGWFPVEGEIRNVLRATPRPPIQGGVPMLVTTAVDNTWGGNKRVNSQNAAFLALLQSARQTIFLQVPNLNAEEAQDALVDAASRGVDVTIYLSLNLNNKLEGNALTNRAIAKAMYSKLARKDHLKICWYASSQHSAAVDLGFETSTTRFLAIDGQVAAFGSASWNSRAWYKSIEMNIVIASPSDVKKLTDLVIGSQNSQASCYPLREALPQQYASVYNTALDITGDAMCGLGGPERRFSRRLRIGIFQGSYSPVHLGHVMGALTMREAMRLDCVWIVSTYDKSFEKVHVIPETYDARNQLLVEIIKDLPFLRMVELPQKYKPGLPQLSTYRPDIDFIFLGGEDLVDEYYLGGVEGEIRRKVVNMFTSVCPFIGIKRRSTVKDGKAKMQSLVNSEPFDYFASVIGKPIVVSRDYFSTSSTTVRNGLCADCADARAELRRALGRNAAAKLRNDPGFATYLGLLRQTGGNTTNKAMILVKGAMFPDAPLVISPSQNNINCRSGPAEGRGIFVTNLSPLRIQTLFEATMVYLTSEVPVHCIVLQPTVPLFPETVDAIQLVLKRYPFLTLNWELDRFPPYVMRIHEQNVGEQPLPRLPGNVDMTPDAKLFVYPAWTHGEPNAEGYTTYEKPNLGYLPPEAHVFHDALPSEPWKGNNHYQGMIDQAELPAEVFANCVEIGFEYCSKK